jgi:hypothetical protein
MACLLLLVDPGCTMTRTNLHDSNNSNCPEAGSVSPIACARLKLMIKMARATAVLRVMNFERDFLSNWSQNLTPAEKSSFEPDLLETIQIGGERVFRKAWHSLDFDSDEFHGWVAESGTDKHFRITRDHLDRVRLSTF